jgi:hypothetical protein
VGPKGPTPAVGMIAARCSTSLVGIDCNVGSCGAVSLHTTADVCVCGDCFHIMDRFHPLLKATQICIKITGHKETNLFNNIHLAGRRFPDLYTVTSLCSRGPSIFIKFCLTFGRIGRYNNRLATHFEYNATHSGIVQNIIRNM